MNILVTGAGGLIGSHATSALARKGYRVTGTYRIEPKDDPGVQALVVDLLSPGAHDQMAGVQAEMIVHAAAVLPRTFEDQSARDAATENRAIDDLVLRLARKSRCPVVYLSSSSVYGMSGVSWDETSPVSPFGPYAEGKLAGEAMFLGSGFRCTALRISAPYGPGQRVRNVLRLFLDRALNNQDLVYFGDGTREQDFIHASDIANAVLKAVEISSVSGIINVASARPVSMRELAQLVIRNVAGTTSKVTASGQPDSQEHYRPRIDISRALSILDWRPEVSLEDGVRRWGLTLRTDQCASV